MSIFMDLRQARDYWASPNNVTKNSLEQSIDLTLRTAMAAGRRSATVDLAAVKGSASDNDVRHTLQELNSLGYRAQFVKGNVMEVQW